MVPTKDRPDDLRVLLNSFEKQTIIPSQIVVCDGSSPPVESLCAEYSTLPISYIRCFPPSLSKQRNAGMAAVKPGITIAGYLDDDIELAPDATEEMMLFWEKAPTETGGASLGIVNQPTNSRPWLHKLFGIDSPCPGDVLPSGFATSIPFPEKTIETKWLYGGATLWKKEVFNNIEYDEWYIGHGYLEDLDYSYRVSQKYRLFVVPESRCWHYPRDIPDNKRFVFGRQQIFNRFYFIKKMGGFSKFATLWAIIGLFTLSILALVRHMDKPRIEHFKGMASGLMAVWKKRNTSFEGSWKD